MTPNADYNYWHKTAYQLDFNLALKTNRILHHTIINALQIPYDGGVGKFLLDIACGKGALLKEFELQNFHGELHGLDISSIAINDAQQYVPRAKYVVGDAQQLPYSDNTFDYITCLGGLEYYPDPLVGAQEIARVLKSNGRFVAQVPNLMFVGHIYMALRYGIMPSESAESEDGKFYENNIEKFYTYEGWKKIFECAELNVNDCQSYNLILGSKKVSKITRGFYNRVIRHFVPFYGSYCFVFVGTKTKQN